MLGRLVIDKSNQDISCFLRPLKITDDAGGVIARQDFEDEMERLEDLRDTRTPFNKGKFTIYFGFLWHEIINRDTQFLHLTNRGRYVLDMIEEYLDKDNKKKLRIKQSRNHDFIDLIVDSVIFTKFGKYNVGVPNSNTDICPVRIILKLIANLGQVTKNEIIYFIFAMNYGEIESWEKGVEVIKEKRAGSQYGYKNKFNEWGIEHIVDDFKLLGLLCTFNLLTESVSKDNNVGDNIGDRKWFSFSERVLDKYLDNILNINPYEAPLQLMFLNKCDIKEIKVWIKNIALGHSVNETRIYEINLGDKLCYDGQGEFEEQPLEKALLNSYKEKNKDVFLVVYMKKSDSIAGKFGIYANSLDRNSDFQSDKYGFSKNPINNQKIYDYLKRNLKRKERPTQDDIRFLPNFNIIIVLTE